MHEGGRFIIHHLLFITWNYIDKWASYVLQSIDMLQLNEYNIIKVQRNWMNSNFNDAVR